MSSDSAFCWSLESAPGRIDEAVIGAVRFGEIDFLCVGGGRDHARAHRLADFDGGKSDAARRAQHDEILAGSSDAARSFSA